MTSRTTSFLGLLLVAALSCSSGGGGGRRTPVILSVTPSTGDVWGGTQVLITTSGFGSDFQASHPEILFGTTPATVVSAPAIGSVEVLTPAQPEGSVDVTVTSADGKRSARAPDAFLYIAPAACSITSITPSIAPNIGGTPVTIEGTGFPLNPDVTFAGIPASVITPISGTRIDVETPGGPLGLVDVVVSDTASALSCTAVDGFEFIDVPPPPPCLITSICPDNGDIAGGEVVTIVGDLFWATPRVWFGAVESAQVTFVSAQEITAVAPAGTANGAVDVIVENPIPSSCWVTGGYTYWSTYPTPDVHEPNPDMGTCGGGGVPFFGTNLNLHDAADVDWYCSDLGHSATLTITLTPDAGTGNLDVELWNTMSGTLISGSYQTSGPDVIVESLTFGFYAVKVYGECGAVGGYSLSITD